jgi:serine/threonine protein kinase
MLEKPYNATLEKYNKPEVLEKQAKIMQEDSNLEGQCVLGKEGALGEKILLNDFKIKRVIDKGSFGKVYLVINQKTRTMYAMKRINKDILIEKKQISNIKNEKDILF